MNEEGRHRAAAAFLRAVGTHSADSVARSADIADPSTVRDFVNGDRWPRAATREKLERFAGMSPGTLERVARGIEDDASEADPVESALRRSELIEWRRNDVITAYQRHLYEQHEAERRGAG